VLDLALDMLNRERKGDVRFIQVGANDGIHEDPCYPWLRNYPWRGVLVEPLPDLAARLKVLHSERPGVAVAQAVVTDSPGELEFFTLRADVPLPVEAAAISSLDRALVVGAARHFRVPGLRIESFKVPALTIGQLMSQYELEALDFLQVDAEGYDARILASIDFRSVRPAVIAYEHANLGDQDRRACRDLLKNQGYQFGTWLGDTVAVQTEMIPAVRLAQMAAERPRPPDRLSLVADQHGQRRQ
jgi:FkbM family methyltransferase